MREDFYFFWTAHSTFSNWYLEDFEFRGVKFSSSEQYMMWAKAVLFGDDVVAKKVMSTFSPKEQKALGRTVKGFDQQVWQEVCVDVMVPALIAKFSQSVVAKHELKSSGKRIIVEASPYDKIWGIGLAADDPRAWDQSTWQGKNLLGVCLMKVREHLWPELANETT